MTYSSVHMCSHFVSEYYYVRLKIYGWSWEAKRLRTPISVSYSQRAGITRHKTTTPQVYILTSKVKNILWLAPNKILDLII